MGAAWASVCELRNAASLLSTATDTNALALLRQTQQVLITSVDRLRAALKGRANAIQRPNRYAETPWSITQNGSGSKPGKARAAEFNSQGKTNGHTEHNPKSTESQ